MILSQEQWMNLRAFNALAEAGATWAEIARETGYDWRTVKRHLSADAPVTPPAPAKRGPGPRLIDPYAHLIDAWLRKPAGRLRVRTKNHCHFLFAPYFGCRLVRWYRCMRRL